MKKYKRKELISKKNEKQKKKRHMSTDVRATAS